MTEGQLIEIDKIIDGDIEVIDYKAILHDISLKISNVENMVYDIGDVGNEIGIAVGKHIKCEED